MKKYLEYVGLLALACFSFYYTERVTKIMNSKDPIMISIENYKNENKVSCKEGYVTTDGVVLGVSGIIVDTEESYSKMQGYKFDETKLVFDEVKCEINKTTAIDKYIIKGNEGKDSVSLFINVNDGTLIEKLVNVADSKNIKLNIIVTGSVLETHKEFLMDAYNNNHEIIYGGLEENDFKKYKSIMKEFENNPRTFCANIGIKDILETCKKENINSIKVSDIYTKDILLNTKTNLEKGKFFVYKENNNTLNELSATINYIEGKKIKIINLSEMLS